MSRIIVITRESQQTSLPAKPGLSVMEIIRDGGVEELLALCGGCCSCATCHVYVEPEFAAVLPPITADESDLLDGSSHRNAQSRLSCQIPFTEALDSMKITIAPED